MTVAPPTRANKLFGTEEPQAKIRTLRAGPLSVELEAGKLRYVRMGGHEAIRGIAFVVRGPAWQTYHPAISNLAVTEGDDEFQVFYDGDIDEANGSISFRAEIVGSPAGGLQFNVTARTGSDFETGRTGFVILHAVEGVAGKPCTILHVDGTSEETEFSAHVMPLQPFIDVRAMTHEVTSGLRVTCRMEGEHAWKCEDQRNWTDASYKTYYRPLSLSFPYVIEGGSEFDQSVGVTFDGAASDPEAGDGGAVEITLGAASGKKMPRIGIGVPADLGEKSLAALELLRGVGPQLLVAEYRADQSREDLSACQQLAEAFEVELMVASRPASTRWKRKWPTPRPPSPPPA